MESPYADIMAYVIAFAVLGSSRWAGASSWRTGSMA